MSSSFCTVCLFSPFLECPLSPKVTFVLFFLLSLSSFFFHRICYVATSVTRDALIIVMALACSSVSYPYTVHRVINLLPSSSPSDSSSSSSLLAKGHERRHRETPLSPSSRSSTISYNYDFSLSLFVISSSGRSIVNCRDEVSR